jgi:hypothetical protein
MTEFFDCNVKNPPLKAALFDGQGASIPGLRRFCNQWMLIDPKHGHNRVNRGDYLVDFGGVMKVFTNEQFNLFFVRS